MSLLRRPREVRGIWSVKVFKCIDQNVPSQISRSHTFPIQGPDLGKVHLPGLKIQLSLQLCYSYNEVLGLILNLLLPQEMRNQSIFTCCQGGPLIFTLSIQLVINHPQPFLVFLQCISATQQAIVLIITTSKPLKA